MLAACSHIVNTYDRARGRKSAFETLHIVILRKNPNPAVSDWFPIELLNLFAPTCPAHVKVLEGFVGGAFLGRVVDYGWKQGLIDVANAA